MKVTTLRQRPMMGVMLVLLAVTCFAAMDSGVRYAGQRLPILPIMVVRYLVQTLLMTLWVWCTPRLSFRTAHPRFQVTRGALLLLSSTFNFFGLQAIPLAELTAINLLGPVAVTVTAAWLLRERLSPLRVALVVGGFVGALIVVRPGSGLFGWAVLLPLGNVVCFTAFQLLSGRIAALDNPYTTNFYTGVTATAILLPLALIDSASVVPALHGASWLELALLLLIGVLGSGGHLLLVMALAFARTSTLMPLLYAQLAAATLFGWLMFDNLPDGWGWLGMLVIAVCGAATTWLNVRAAAAVRRPIAATAVDTVVE